MALPLRASPELQRVRDQLGAAVGAEAAAKVLFEALDHHGGSLPCGSREIAAFVEGPLRAAIERQLGRSAAERVVASLGPGDDEAEVTVLGPDAGSGARARSLTPAAGFLCDTTVGSRKGPVRLIAIARGGRLAERLRLAVGADDVAVGVAHSPQQACDLAYQINASMIIIDGTDIPPGGEDQFVDGLGGLPSDVMLVLWSEGGPSAERLTAGLEFCSLRVTVLDRREGVAPLIDMVRAQRGG